MNQRIGYARVSTDDQHLDLQRDALQQAGCCVIYEEAASGKNTTRPELEQCRKALRAGDTLVVWRLDRLGRSLPDLVQIVTANRCHRLLALSVPTCREPGHPDSVLSLSETSAQCGFAMIDMAT